MRHPLTVPEPDAAVKDKPLLARHAALTKRVGDYLARREDITARLDQARSASLTDIAVGNIGSDAVAQAVAAVDEELALRRDLDAFAGDVAAAHRRLIPAASDAHVAAVEETGRRLRDAGYTTAANVPGWLPNFDFVVSRSAAVAAAAGRVDELSAKTNPGPFRAGNAEAIDVLERRAEAARARLLALPV